VASSEAPARVILTDVSLDREPVGIASAPAAERAERRKVEYCILRIMVGIRWSF